MLFVVYNSTGQSDIFLAACRLTDFLLGHRKVGSTRCYAQPFCITNPLYTYSGIPTTLPGSGFISLQTFLHIATRVFFQKCQSHHLGTRVQRTPNLPSLLNLNYFILYRRPFINHYSSSPSLGAFPRCAHPLHFTSQLC